MFHLLFKVSPVLFIHQHQVQEVPHRELLIDISHCSCEVIASQEEAYGNGLAWQIDEFIDETTFPLHDISINANTIHNKTTFHWCSIHYLVLSHSFCLCSCARACQRNIRWLNCDPDRSPLKHSLLQYSLIFIDKPQYACIHFTTIQSHVFLFAL